MEVLGMSCLPYRKRFFWKHQWSVFFFMAQIIQILLFSRMTVLQRSKSTVWEGNLFKKNCYGSFWFASTLHKKVFLETPMKCFSLYASNNSDFVVFGCWFCRDQRSQFENKNFSKINLSVQVSGLCLPYVKRFFQEHQWSAFFLIAQITQILLF